MDTSLSLPNKANAEDLLKNFPLSEKYEENETKWRTLCLSALSYGTDYDFCPSLEAKSDDKVEKERSPTSLKTRAKETLEFFSGILLDENAKKMLTAETDTTTQSNPYFILVDVFWLISSIFQREEKDKLSTTEQQDALFIIVRGLASQLPSIFTQRLQMTLDGNLLSKFELVPVNFQFYNKARKYVTNIHYRQNKFNLLVEESEGYSKLLMFLFSEKELILEEQNGKVMGIIRELMGSFCLDPNRVLDLILLVLEFYLEKIQLGEQSGEVLPVLLCILKEFKRESLPQLMGFKLLSLHASKGTQKENESLCLTCVYLICHGLLQLEDLIPHLESSIIEIDNLYKANRRSETKKLRKLGTISLNASNADKEEGKDESQVSNPATTVNVETLLPQNQVISILEFLIHYKGWNKVYSSAHLFLPSETSTKNPGIYVLSRACTISPSFASAVLKTINDIIEPVYETTVRCKNSFFASMKQQKDQENKSGGMSKFEKMSKFIPNLGEVKRVEEIENIIEYLYIPISIVTDSGCIQTDPTLYCKCCRLFKSFLSQKNVTFQSIDAKLLAILQMFLVPSLSLFPSNPSVSAELWSCLNELDYTVRYVLYDAWKGTMLEKRALRIGIPPPSISPQSAKPLARVESEIRTGIACRYILKRLSSKNFLETGRRLAKTCHNNPIIVFTLVLNQIETYDNLIDLMVDSFKYSTKLSLDILSYCLLSSLGGGAKKLGRVKSASDGMGTTQWLTSLSQFTGVLFKKFPEVEIRGVLFHLIGELRQGQTSGLPVLLNLLTNAGGYDFANCDTISSLSDAQLEGRSGSQMLKRETSQFGIVESFSKISSSRLREVLQDKRLGLPLLILLTQVKEKIMYESNESQKQHLKVIGKLYDSCHSIFGLLLEFLTDLSDDRNGIEKYAEILPSLLDLNEAFKISPVIAWMIYRPLIRFVIAGAAKSKKNEEEGEEDEDGKGKKSTSALPKTLSIYHPLSKDMMSTYKSFVPSSSWSYLSPVLYGYFWSLSLYDINCPESRYDTEHKRLTTAFGKITKTLMNTQQNPEEDRRLKQEKKTLLDAANLLLADQKVQTSHTQFIHSMLEEKKQEFFSNRGENKLDEDPSIYLLSTCTFPRCTLSPEDALYCAKFVEKLHKFETPGFNILKYLDHLISAVCGSLFCITEDEAGNISILLRETWGTISNWRYDEDEYENEISSRVGSEEMDTSNRYSDYISLYNKWHLSIGLSLMGCLKSKEYIHVRAAIVVLNRIVDVYPTRPKLGQKLMKHLTPLQEDDSLPDIKVMANAYAAQLEKARREGVWKEQDADEANKIIEEEKLKAEEKKKEAQSRMDDMKKENEEIALKSKNFRRGRYTQDQPSNPSSAVFTPANGNPRSLNNTQRDRSYRREPRSDRKFTYPDSNAGTRGTSEVGAKRDRVEGHRDGSRGGDREGHNKRVRVSSSSDRRSNAPPGGRPPSRVPMGRSSRSSR